MGKRIESGTCLAVVRETYNKKKKGELVIAADRRVSSGHNYQIAPFRKVNKRNGVILAGTGLASIIELIIGLLPIPEVPDKMSSFEYVNGPFTTAVEDFLKSKGFHTEGGFLCFPKRMNTSILVIVKSSLFTMSFDDDYGIVINSVNTPYADGCGGAYALGSLVTTSTLKISSETRLKLALKVAAQLSSGCDDNIDIIRESDKDSG